MRAVGVVVGSLVLVLAGSVRVARAQPGQTAPSPPGGESSTTPAAPSSSHNNPVSASSPASRIGFGTGFDFHLGIGDLSESSFGMHAELILAGQHMLVVRGGFGQRSWADAEFDDPTYKERYARIGYRIASDHIYAGFDVGRAWDRAHWDSTDAMPAHDGSWFAATTGTGMIGWMLGPVDLGVDYTISDESYFGVYLGMGVWRR